MRFVKAHLISLLCGVAAVGFVAIAVLGMTSTTVVEQMRERIQQTGAREIATLKANPKNERIIEAERRKIEESKREHDEAVKVSQEISRRKPLMAGVFPQPEKRSTGFEFIQAYKQALALLPVELMAGSLPTEEEVEDEKQNVADLIALEAEQAEEGGEKAPAITQRSARMARAAPTGDMGLAGGPRIAGRIGPAGRFAGGRTGGSTLDKGEPKYDPVYRARVTKAKSIRCYVDPSVTFHVSPIVDATSAPSPEELWFAQVGLWIQQDVVAAVAQLNKAAAQQVTDGEAYVEQMPVKRIGLLRVLGYETPSGLLQFPGNQGAGQPGPSFTKQESNDQFDVVRFVLAVVADQRDILELIDQISKQNFYQCIGASYSMVSPGDAQSGYLYGTEPVVRVQLEFEGYMARAVYQSLMPTEVRQLLGIEQAKEGQP